MFDKLSESEKKFIEFINMMGSTALFQLGKIASPATGKIEKDLKGAKFSIDLLVMIKEKTKGNLSSQEEKMLEELLSHIQMNYVDEVNKEKGNGGETRGTEESAPEPEKTQTETPSEASPEALKKEDPPSQENKSESDEDAVLNWEKHERKNYGSSEDKDKK